VEGANTALEIIPFYDVQLTWLGRWNETPTNFPFNVSNDQAIQTGNTHDRGMATLEGFGTSTINVEVNRGNLGLTGSDPIDPTYSANLLDYDMYALGDSTPDPVPTGYIVRGSITSQVPGVKASDVEITASNDVQCDRTNTGYECIVPSTANNPRLTISNYFKNTKNIVGCSDTLAINGEAHSGSSITGNWTRFNLPVPVTGDISNANIYITVGTSCP
jgi:hypothetical protein